MHSKPSGNSSHDDLNFSYSLGKPKAQEWPLQLALTNLRPQDMEGWQWGWEGGGEARLDPGIIAKDQLRKRYYIPMILLQQLEFETLFHALTSD